jgi:hypothetical protein
MRTQRLLVRALIGFALISAGCGNPLLWSEAKAADSGTVVGTLTGKGANWIAVRADGATESQRYVPRWVGGMPNQGGGLDKAMLRIIQSLRVPSRVRLAWVFEERRRVVRIEVLNAEQPTSSGVVEGTITAKGETWIEVKPAGDTPAERYMPRWIGGMPSAGGGLDRDMLRLFAQLRVGQRVRLEWILDERKRVVRIAPLSGLR